MPLLKPTTSIEEIEECLPWSYQEYLTYLYRDLGYSYNETVSVAPIFSIHCGICSMDTEYYKHQSWCEYADEDDSFYDYNGSEWEDFIASGSVLMDANSV